jgi:ribosomal protein S12 methylthiotransferase accessory factor
MRWKAQLLELVAETNEITQWVDYGSCIRRRHPEETLELLLQQHKRFGITRLADVTGLDSLGIPVAIAIRPGAKSVSVSQGKGLTLVAAKVSALMEAIEIHHAENLPDPDYFCSVEALAEQCVRPALPKTLDPIAGARVRWDADVAHAWYRSSNIIDMSDVVIPGSLLSMDTCNWSLDTVDYDVTTNGLASGNDLAEAVCHSIFEIVERHAFSAWLRLDVESRAGTGVNIQSLSGCNAQLANRASAAGMELTVFDLSKFALGLPCYVAEIASPIDPVLPARPYTGRGLHVSSQVALTRAITEAAQSRITMISGARDDNLPEDYYLPREASRSAQALRFKPEDRSFVQAWQRHPIDFIRKILTTHQFHACYVYPHRVENSSFTVVRCFVPGMEHVTS